MRVADLHEAAFAHVKNWIDASRRHLGESVGWSTPTNSATLQDSNELAGDAHPAGLRGLGRNG